MTRLDAEMKCIELMKQIDAIIKEYFPENNYWSGGHCGNSYAINNDYWELGVAKINIRVNDTTGELIAYDGEKETEEALKLIDEILAERSAEYDNQNI